MQANISHGFVIVRQGVTGSKVHYLVLNELAVLKAMAGSPHVVQLYSFMHPEGGE
jgi:hypothetical protein